MKIEIGKITKKVGTNSTAEVIIDGIIHVIYFSPNSFPNFSTTTAYGTWIQGTGTQLGGMPSPEPTDEEYLSAAKNALIPIITEKLFEAIDVLNRLKK